MAKKRKGLLRETTEAHLAAIQEEKEKIEKYLGELRTEELMLINKLKADD